MPLLGCNFSNLPGWLAIVVCAVMAVPACAETLQLRPMAWLYSDDPDLLGRGIPDQFGAQSDSSSPISLPNVPSQLRLRALDETAINNRAWTSVSRQGRLDANYRLGGSTPRNVWLAATVRGFTSEHEGSGDDDISVTQRAEEQQVAVAGRPRENVTLGAGYVHDEAGTELLYGVAAEIPDAGSVHFRRFPLRTDLVARLNVDDRIAELNVTSHHEVDEVGIQYDFHDAASVVFTSDISKRINLNSIATLRAFQDWALVAAWSKDESDITGVVTVDDTVSGATAGTAASERKTIALRYGWASGDVLVGVSTRRLDIAAVGNVEDKTLQDFWSYLLPGKRYFNARYGLRSTERFIGLSQRQSDRLVWRTGMQHVDITYTGNFRHWTTLPYLPVSKFDLSESNDTDSATFFGLTFGFGYSVGAWEVSYGIGQLIPLEHRDRKGESQDTSGSAASGARSKAKKGSNPGGNVQVLQLIWRFS